MNYTDYNGLVLLFSHAVNATRIDVRVIFVEKDISSKPAFGHLSCEASFAGDCTKKLELKKTTSFTNSCNKNLFSKSVRI